MDSVQVFTKDRMQAIEDSAIVDGDVVGDNLILTRHDGGTINAGSVRGPVGPIGSSPIVVTSTTRPTTGLYNGLVIYEIDTGQTFMYNGTGWMSYEPTRICTSTTHPALPFNGMKIYETDTRKELIWNGVRFDRVWNSPWGGVGGAGIGLVFGTTETAATYNPGPVSFTNPGNRNYKVKLNAGVYRGGTPSDHQFWIKRNGTIIRTFHPSNVVSTISDDRYTFMDEYNDQPPPGLVTYTVTGRTSAGTANFDVAIQNCILTVEDIGPWGPPV
jgi:hypothetical protein